MNEGEKFYYRLGFQDGYSKALDKSPMSGGQLEAIGFMLEDTGKKTKRKVKQSPKQKLLTKMTKKKWDRYKKGRGKKTYVEIRGEVSRSQAYKKACKRL
jgi:hypothetical protein